MKKVLICIDDSEHDIKVAQEGILIVKSMNAEISLRVGLDCMVNTRPIINPVMATKGNDL